MAAPAPYLEFGYVGPQLLADGNELEQEYEGIDRRRCVFYSDSEDTYQEGQPIPQFPGFTIDRITTTRDGPKYEHRLECIGIKGGKSTHRLRGYPKRVINLTDWDTIDDAWVTSNRAQFKAGQKGNYGGVTVCVSAPDEPLYGDFYRVNAKFIGIIETKPYQRTISCNGQQVSGDSIRVDLPGGGTSWNDYRKGVASLPKIVVTDRRLTTTPPPTGLVPGASTPPNPPQVKVFSITGDDLTSHWPNGWTLTLESNQVPGGLYDNRFIYEWQWYQTP